ncbi:MAG TPA: hypothetical protein VEM93_00580 [Actinomycetota bacterium]|nr:hypothetical protein [Actinomycetota bacterium]
MTNRNAEPEREMVRRIAPFGLPAAAAALAAGALAGGWGVGWSASVGIAVVTLNFVANGLSLARAARVSLQALMAVALLGFVVRLGAILAFMFLLNRFGWFSPLAFGLAVVPATILLLGFEMKLLAGGLGTELQIPPPAGAARGRLFR